MLLGRDGERGEQANRRGAGGVDDQTLLEQRTAHDLGRGDVDLAGEHQAASADGEHMGQLGEAVTAEERLPRARARATSESEVTSNAASARSRHDGATGERGAVVAGLEHVGQPRAGDERADRQPAAERLGAREGVRDDAGLLVSP